MLLLLLKTKKTKGTQTKQKRMLFYSCGFVILYVVGLSLLIIDVLFDFYFVFW